MVSASGAAEPSGPVLVQSKPIREFTIDVVAVIRGANQLVFPLETGGEEGVLVVSICFPNFFRFCRRTIAPTPILYHAKIAYGKR